MSRDVSTPALQPPTVGIIGLGSFGTFAAQTLQRQATVLVYDNDQLKIAPKGAQKVALSEVAQADCIILAVPLGVLPNVLSTIRSHLSPHTLLIDVCSVKLEPTRLYKTILPKHTEVLLTHPLFGPESARSSVKAQTLIVTNKPTATGQKVLRFCEQQLGLTVHHTSAKAHDTTMAEVHALTFFIARTLRKMQLEKPAFITPSFRMIEDLISYDTHHSEALFETMELGNPYAGEVRNTFLRHAIHINETLEKQL